MKKWLGGLFAIMMALAVHAKTHQAGIASAHRLATQAGIKILAQGGNAFDAAVAVASALAVVEPYDSGFGGGGFFLIHDAKHNKDVIIDAREVAPLAATKTMFQDKQGRVIAGKSLFGALSAAIPGEPAGIAYLQKHYGRLSLAQDLAPAISLAEKGFAVNRDYRNVFKYPGVLKHLNAEPHSKNTFLARGKRPALGRIIKQPALAATIKRFAKLGHDGFYRGATAKAMVKAVRAGGGLWTEEDLAQYHVKLRQPIQGTYKNVSITTMPPPSAGGVAILEILNILDQFDLAHMQDLQQRHHIIEAMRLTYWDRDKYIGDPDFVNVPVNALISRTHARHLLKYIKKDQATPSSDLPRSHPAEREKVHTSHFSVIDKEGNMVAATISLNYIFGSSFTAGDTGVLLNDHMDDFSTKVGSANVFGLIGSEANSIAPGKRPVSSMSPTFIRDAKHVGVLGSTGGSRIPTQLLLAILDFSAGHDARSWVAVPRYHHQYIPDVVQFELGTLTARVRKGLEAMGYRVSEMHRTYGDMNAVMLDKASGKVIAANDPRHHGLAIVATE